jgi:hypothetical protein
VSEGELLTRPRAHTSFMHTIGPPSPPLARARARQPPLQPRPSLVPHAYWHACSTPSCMGERASVFAPRFEPAAFIHAFSLEERSGDVRRPPRTLSAQVNVTNSMAASRCTHPLPLEPIAPNLPSRLRRLIACAPCSQVISSRGSTSTAAAPPPSPPSPSLATTTHRVTMAAGEPPSPSAEHPPPNLPLCELRRLPLRSHHPSRRRPSLPATAVRAGAPARPTTPDARDGWVPAPCDAVTSCSGNRLLFLVLRSAAGASCV